MKKRKAAPRVKRVVRSESSVVVGVLRYLNSFPHSYAWRNNTGKLPDRNGRIVAFGCPGSPDILCIAAGAFVGVECKSDSGKMRAGQTTWAARFTARGGVYIVARSVEDVKRALEGAT